MADKKKGQLFFFFKLHKQLHDLFLYRHIQGTGCLITDQNFGFYSQSSGNGRSLALPSADLMRITVCIFRSQAAGKKKFFHTVPGFLLTYPHIPETFPDSVPNGAPGIKGSCRCLKYHLKFPVSFPESFSLRMCDIFSQEKNLSICNIR